MTLEEFKLLVANLPQASSLDLYRLAYLSRALYSEPHRILAIRKELHVGKTVQYFDSNHGTNHSGRVIALRDRDFSLEDRDRNLRFKSLPYAAIDVVATESQSPSASHEPPTFGKDQPPNIPKTKRPTKSDFSVGGRVSFINREGHLLIGVIVRMNQKTATVLLDLTGGQWRVSYSLLHHLVDV